MWTIAAPTAWRASMAECAIAAVWFVQPASDSARMAAASFIK
jgi:hypothetical protein